MNILYTKDFNERIDKSVNVILSPEFYWIKKVDIKDISLKEAKKLAASILKLPVDEFFFDAIKKDDEFYVIAIKKDIKIDIDKKFIKSIRIAECEIKEDCVNLKKGSLKRVGGILFYFNNRCENGVDIKKILDNLKLSKYRFDYVIASFSKSFYYLLVGSLVLFIVSFLIKGSVYYFEKEKIKKMSNFSITTYQLDSMINNLLNKIEKKEKLIKVLKFIQKVPLKEKEYIKKIEYLGDKVRVVIFGGDVSYFKKYKYKKLNNNEIEVVIDVK